MTGICPVCQQGFPATGAPCSRLDCPRRAAGLFDQATHVGMPAPQALFGQATQLGPGAPPGLPPLPPTWADPPRPPDLSSQPLTIPGYQVLREIGRGGMGLVLEARQLSLDRKVAIKVLPPHLAANPDFVARFLRESSTLAQLAHPNLVTVIDRGQVGAVCYFVMEFVQPPEGDRPHDLQQLIRTRALDSRQTHRLILQVVRALDFAHRQGVIHRDIKPGNVLLDRHGNARITDFGIAAVLGEQRTDGPLTAAGVGMGTLEYMAPEQRYDAGRIDHRADVYATGVMLYEMLTGRRPAIEYVPPSQAVPGLHPAWDGVVERALKTHPQDRYADMAAFAAAIELVNAAATVAPALAPGVQPAFTAATVPATPAPTPAPTGPTGVSCLACSGPLRDASPYCPHCSLPTSPECPRCGVRAKPGHRYCVGCRTDLIYAPHFEGYRQHAQRLLESADEAGPAGERASQAQQALEAFQAALQLFPDHQPTTEAVLRSRALALKLWLQAGDQARSQGDHVQAKAAYQRVLAEQPDHPHAGKRLDELDRLRDRELSEAAEFLARGEFGPAAQSIQRLLVQQPGEPRLLRLLRLTRQHERLVKECVESRMPRLEQERRFVELHALLGDLERRNLPVPGLERTLERCRERLKTARELCQQAAQGRKQGDPEEAERLARQALQAVADHPVAQGLLGLGPDGRRRRGNPWRAIGSFLLRATLVLTLLAGAGGAAWWCWQDYLSRKSQPLPPSTGELPTWFWYSPEQADFTVLLPTDDPAVEPFTSQTLRGTRYSASHEGRTYHVVRASLAQSLPPSRLGDQPTLLQVVQISSSDARVPPAKTVTSRGKEFREVSIQIRGRDAIRLQYVIVEDSAYYFWVTGATPARLEAEDVTRFFNSIQVPLSPPAR